MNVSPSFSPPIKLMKPYFLISSFTYFLSMIALFMLDYKSSFVDLHLIAWVHLYLVGFIMNAIFSAMAQLGPIVIESEHFEAGIFKYLWILLLSGLALLLFGFIYNALFLPYGGLLILLAISIYAIEFLLTLKNSKRKTAITKAMKMSNFFLLSGILTGLIMALSFNGFIEIDPHSILKIHTFGLLAGFIILLIMGISIILIPMFGSSKRISDNAFSNSFYTMSIGVIFMMLSPLLLSTIFQNISYFFVIVSIILYLYQLFSMAKSRKRVEHDIWAKNMYLAFFSFMLAFLLLILSLFLENELYTRLGLWLLFIGFFAPIIIGNFYKIVPFLVWFHIYSPLIQERAVPMLHELLPNRLAHLQYFYLLCGVIFTFIAIALSNNALFLGGVVLLSLSAFIFVIIINNILKTKI
ncbi:hypothetical protein [Sulfurimonas sp.]